MNGKKILIVEDESIVALEIEDALISLGYSVVGKCTKGRNALVLAEAKNPDLVLMDIILNGELDGIETAEIMREKFDVPVVFLTANSDKETISRAKVTKPYGYVIKPFEKKELFINIELSIHNHYLEKRVRENENWLSTVMKSIGEGIIATDSKGRIKFVNNIAEEIVELDNTAMIGNSITDIIALKKNGVDDKVEIPIYKAIKEEKICRIEDDAVLITKSGKEIFIEGNVSPVLDDSKITGSVLAFQDITEKKLIEQELIKNEKKLVENSLKLEDANESLKRINKQKDQFFSIISHDLRSPFSSLIGLTNFLKEDIAYFSREEIKEIVNNVNQSAYKVYNLLENLLHWSRIQTEKLDLEPREINIFDLITSCTLTLKGNALTKNIKFDNSVSENEVCFADELSIELVVQNLISNAIKFSNPGGIIHIDSKLNDDFIEISVKDSGVGINAEDQAKLFKIDQNVSTLGTCEEKGTGLGLILCKELVEKNGGEIWLNSKLNEGSTFAFKLPLTQIDKDINSEV